VDGDMERERERERERRKRSKVRRRAFGTTVFLEYSFLFSFYLKHFKKPEDQTTPIKNRKAKTRKRKRKVVKASALDQTRH
jgi:hypothetical protein